MVDTITAHDVAQGDYISGEEAIYEVEAVDGGQFKLTVAAHAFDDHVPEGKLGWHTQTLGYHHPAEQVDSVDVSDGDTLTWHGAYRDGSDAEATVRIADDGSVDIDCDSPLVADEYLDVLHLKIPISRGVVTVHD